MEKLTINSKKHSNGGTWLILENVKNQPDNSKMEEPISVLLGLELAWAESVVDFSLNCVEWSKKSSPLSSFWKTYQPLELEVFEELSENLQIWGMIVGGLVFLPRKLEPTTQGKGGSCWPTPNAQGGTGYMSGSKRDTWRPTLAGAVRMAPVGDPPTITADQFRGQGRMAAYIPVTTGMLNPMWVELLMGVPLGWTELKPWAMEWFRPKSKRRLKD